MRPIVLPEVRDEAPICEAFDDLDKVRAYEIAMRRHRAHVEPFTVTPLDRRVDGAFRVKSGRGSEYTWTSWMPGGSTTRVHAPTSSRTSSASASTSRPCGARSSSAPLCDARRGGWAWSPGTRCSPWARASYEAVAAALREVAGPGAPSDHAGLVATLYRDLLPSGAVPASAHALLARLHDLGALQAAGVELPAAVAEDALEEAAALVSGLSPVTEV